MKHGIYILSPKGKVDEVTKVVLEIRQDLNGGAKIISEVSSGESIVYILAKK